MNDIHECKGIEDLRLMCANLGSVVRLKVVVCIKWTYLTPSKLLATMNLWYAGVGYIWV